jgi:8-oxo-dGTP diphosphatase
VASIARSEKGSPVRDPVRTTPPPTPHALPKRADASDIFDFPRSFVTVDTILFTMQNSELRVLLIRRGADPYKDMWAIPGGFANVDESLEAAAERKLKEETGIGDVYLEQLFTYGEPDRDPRARVITVAYYALVRSEGERDDPRSSIRSSGIADAQWFPMHSLPPLAFDHVDILAYAHQRLKYKVEYTDIAFRFLPELFTISDLQTVYEAILGEQLDKRNFRKKITSLGFLEPTEKMRLGAHRPARIYRRAKERPKGTLPGFRWTKLESV